jgi:AcrR family transcriptional regulator
MGVVKSRAYRSPRRAEQARLTRERILEAAQELFAVTGYATTTIAQIADRAGVAVQTVYAVFGTKRAILVAILETRVVGDDEDAALSEREEWKVVQRQREPRAAIRAFAHANRTVLDRIGTVWAVLHDAAAVDPDLRSLEKLSQEQRYSDLRLIAETLQGLGPLRSGLSLDKATDTIWAIASPDLCLQLLMERGWSTDDYEAWLGDILEAALLPQPTQG